jgi:spermidine synthase
MNSFQAVSLVVYSNLVSSALIAAAFRRKRLLILAAASLALSAVFLNVIDLSAISARLQYPGQELVLLKNSVYGSITITDTKGQLNFYENGFPLFSTENQQANEEKVHYAMLAHPAPRSVLLVSGGIAGTTSEILKYSPDRVDYVELDPALIEVGRNFTGSLDDGRVRVHSVDARVYVRETADRYDVVIMDLPDPSSIQVNRFYTREFLEDVKSVLNPDGVVSLHVSGGENYLSEESRKLNSAVYRTVASVFENVLVVPGSTNYYVSSDAHLDYDYASKLSGRGIKTKYFEYYLPGTLAEDRIAYMRSAVSGDSRLNTDFTPISSYYYMSYWMSLFRLDYNVVAVLVVLVLAGALYVSRIKPVPLSIFVIGFSAMALELILIFAFQVIHGYVYAKIGLIVTAFMLGNFIGAYTSNNMLRSSSVTARLLSKLNFIFFAYCLILPSILLRAAGFYNLSMFSPGFLIPSLTFVVGVFVGLAFPIAVKTYEKEASGAVDSASALASLDLFGACVGAMLATVVLIPLYGLIKVTLFVGLMNLASGLYIWFKEK